MSVAGKFTQEEIIALQKFRVNVADVIEKLNDYEAHDVNLLRWLRARDLNLNKAEEMLRKSLQWRSQNNIDVLGTQPCLQEWADRLPIKSFALDKEGTPASSLLAGIWDMKKAIDQGKQDAMVRGLLQIIERGVEYLRINSTPDKMLTNFTLIVDMDQFSLRQARPEVIFCITSFLRVFEANYPERLKHCFLINVPKIFEIVWPLVKPFLTGQTLAKVQILGGGRERWVGTLEKYFNYSDLPSEYGGAITTQPIYRLEHENEYPPRVGIFPDGEFTMEIILAGESLVKSYQLKAGNRITWNFKTETNDIGFYFKRGKQAIFSHARVNSHLYVQEGLVDIKEDDEYSLVFDNSYSRYTQKTLHYLIRVADKKE